MVLWQWTQQVGPQCFHDIFLIMQQHSQICHITNTICNLFYVTDQHTVMQKCEVELIVFNIFSTIKT